jgi:hypothetical protein
VKGDLKGMNMGVEFVARVVMEVKDWEKALLDKYGYGKKGKEGKNPTHMCVRRVERRCHHWYIYLEFIDVGKKKRIGGRRRRGRRSQRYRIGQQSNREVRGGKEGLESFACRGERVRAHML